MRHGECDIMTSDSYDIAIVGAGIIGLATAMTLAKEYPRYKIAVLEKDRDIAMHQTGHNSGVIHAGIYYAPGTQKANFCSVGGRLLREFCDEHDIEYQMCGKLIVAINEEEVPRLEDLFERGTANGAEGLEMVGPERRREVMTESRHRAWRIPRRSDVDRVRRRKQGLYRSPLLLVPIAIANPLPGDGPHGRPDRVANPIVPGRGRSNVFGVVRQRPSPTNGPRSRASRRWYPVERPVVGNS